MPSDSEVREKFCMYCVHYLPCGARQEINEVILHRTGTSWAKPGHLAMALESPLAEHCYHYETSNDIKARQKGVQDDIGYKGSE